MNMQMLPNDSLETKLSAADSLQIAKEVAAKFEVSETIFPTGSLVVGAFVLLGFFVVLYLVLSKIKDDNNATRHSLGLIVIFLAIASMLVIGLYAINAAPDNDAAKDIFNQVLPVVAAWVGTVLAYFFGRENFESASQKFGELLDQVSPKKLAKAISVEQVMIVYESIFFEVDTSKDMTATIEILNTYNKSRFPIFTGLNHDKVVSLLYRDDMIAYMSKQTATKKIADFISEGKERKFITISKERTLKEVSDLMSKEDVQDAFITAEGTPKGRVDGYITLKLIDRFLQKE
ncbi:MAG: hypothetical protein R8N23_10630 [Reichenbachiella sp.]|uniref:hypothetical protein n=1 Tax=Reichenbachiella sp. TaxID=2184521 RepID=UPI002965DD85|nr:hypothetical protein [Reichenbachiella sp.]MDW3210314.1 hypothetical protein [Reichenbachiella sp.]